MSVHNQQGRKTIKGQPANPRYLERIAWCMDMRMKILSLLPRNHLELPGTDGRAIPIKVVRAIQPAGRDEETEKQCDLPDDDGC